MVFLGKQTQAYYVPVTMFRITVVQPVPRYDLLRWLNVATW